MLKEKVTEQLELKTNLKIFHYRGTPIERGTKRLENRPL